MNTNKSDIFKLQADFCKTVANEKRLKIIFLLAKKECSVGEIAEAIGVSISNVSQHLFVLRSRSIVKTRKDGHTVYYTLIHPKLYEACVMMRSVLIAVFKEQNAVGVEIDEMDFESGDSSYLRDAQRDQD